MAAVVTDGDKDSTDSFLCDGDEDGVTFKEATKQYTSISSYPPSSPSPSCCRVSLEAFSPGPACSVTQSVDNIVLPPVLVQLLLKAIPTTSGGTSFHLVVADTGATDHMVPNRGAFISYKSVQGLRVRMGVTIPLLLSWVVERRLSLSTASVFLSAMSSMSHAFGSPFTVSGRIFASRGAVSWGAMRLACTCTSRAWS
jgi:hypothetical protein